MVFKTQCLAPKTPVEHTYGVLEFIDVAFFTSYYLLKKFYRSFAGSSVYSAFTHTLTHTHTHTHTRTQHTHTHTHISEIVTCGGLRIIL